MIFAFLFDCRMIPSSLTLKWILLIEKAISSWRNHGSHRLYYPHVWIQDRWRLRGRRHRSLGKPRPGHQRTLPTVAEPSLPPVPCGPKLERPKVNIGVSTEEWNVFTPPLGSNTCESALRATVCNFRESAVRKRKFEFSFSTPKRPFWWTFLKNDTQKFQRGLILTKTDKVRKAAQPPSKAEVNYAN